MKFRIGDRVLLRDGYIDTVIDISQARNVSHKIRTYTNFFNGKGLEWSGDDPKDNDIIRNLSEEMRNTKLGKLIYGV